MANNGTTIGTAYVRIEPSAKGIGNKISDVLNAEAGNAGASAGSKIASGIGNALKVSGGLILAGTAVATTAVVNFGKEAISQYANYEQLIGGVSKLYGTAGQSIGEYAQSMGKTAEEAAVEYAKLAEAEKLVQENANEAYRTAGMSANQYMESATSFSAALINSLGGDTVKAAELTDVAMRAMSDNVNTFGSDMSSVENAFQGFAKQNYTMLDNLKLGYGGTKEEMQRLIDDANEYRASIGESADLSMNSFADIVQAIQSVQEEQRIAGTTNREAMTTIEGSANATKAAWENVLTSIGRGEGMQEAFDGLLTSIFGGEDGGGLLNNIIPRIETVMQGIGDFVAMASPYISEKIPELINQVVPSLLSGGTTLLIALVDGFVSALPSLASTGITVIRELINSLTSALPDLIPVAIDAILTIVDGLISNIDLVIDAAVKLVVGLTQGLINALPVLIEKVPIIVSKFVNTLVMLTPQILIAGAQMVVGLIQGITNIAPRLQQVGQNLVEGLKNGITGAWNGLVDKVKNMANNLVSSVKKAFGVASPSKVFAQIGDYCVQGFDEGFETFGEGAMSNVENALDDMSNVSAPTFNADMALNANASQYKSASGNTSDLYGLLAQYLPLLERATNVNVSLEGDAQGLFRQIRTQTNRFIKSTGASPFISPA